MARNQLVSDAYSAFGTLIIHCLTILVSLKNWMPLLIAMLLLAISHFFPFNFFQVKVTSRILWNGIWLGRIYSASLQRVSFSFSSHFVYNTSSGLTNCWKFSCKSKCTFYPPTYVSRILHEKKKNLDKFGTLEILVRDIVFTPTWTLMPDGTITSLKSNNPYLATCTSWYLNSTFFYTFQTLAMF